MLDFNDPNARYHLSVPSSRGFWTGIARHVRAEFLPAARYNASPASVRRLRRTSGSTPGYDGFPRLLQASPQRFAGQIVDDGSEQPGHTEWKIACERDRFTGNEDSAVALLEEPVAV